MLRGFRRRADLRRHRASLAGSGIAGTDTPYRFFWPSARWISLTWPGALRIDGSEPEYAQAILDALPRLLEPAQSEFLRRVPNPSLAVIDTLRPAGLTDADWFIGLIAAMPGDDAAREAFFDRIDPPFVLATGATTPERTTARFDTGAVHPQRTPPRGPRPDLRREARRPPRRVRKLGRGDAEQLIRVARGSMATRERDLAAFQFANPRDAFVVEDGGGLAFGFVGMSPERRLLLPAVYGGLTLQNGVPIGYVQLDLLGRHCELSFNQFETFRDGGAGRAFARLVAAARQVFGSDSFSIEPYQLGEDNDEGIDSGAWWFYYRLGFRPRAVAAQRLARREADRAAADGRYRSSPQRLRALSRWHLFYSLEPGRPARLPRVAELHAAATRELTRFSGREPADRAAAASAAAGAWLGAGKLSRGAGSALRSWAPLVLALSQHGRWSRAERRQLLALIAAKAGTSEREYLRCLARHRRLRAILDC